MWLVLLYMNSVHTLSAIPFQYNVAFFPRRTIDKEMGEGSFHWLSQHLESDFTGSSNVNVCQLLALFWTGFLSSDSVILIFPSISVHAYVQCKWSIKIFCANDNNQERTVYAFLKKKIVQYSGILQNHSKPLCGNGSVMCKPLRGEKTPNLNFWILSKLTFLNLFYGRWTWNYVCFLLPPDSTSSLGFAGLPRKLRLV